MKKNLQTKRPVVLTNPVGPTLVATLGFVLALVFAVASQAADSAEPKTHTLFMGADISVEYNKTMYRVQSVVEGAVVINVGGKEVQVAADWSKVKLKVDRTLKLTGTSASVAKLKGERAYSPGKDPWENYQKGLVKAAVQHYEENFAATIAADKRYQLEFENTAGANGGPGALPRDKTALNKAIANQIKAEHRVVAAGESYEHNGLELEGQESFDAMKVTFEVAAEQPLSAPYIVILGQFREKGDKPDTMANWFYARPLDQITSETRKITLLKTGFPPGFEALDFQVHLYNRGQEIATDVAPKRVQLTRAEAHTYARIEYMGSNKKNSLPAKPFMGKLSKEKKAQLSTEQLSQPYYVKVTKEGLPIAAFLDTDCSRPVDETVGALIATVRFYPALEKGQAIEGVAELKFNQLAL